jgi:predicted RNase H-like nuclease (RuvC/YqgF family)
LEYNLEILKLEKKIEKYDFDKSGSGNLLVLSGSDDNSEELIKLEKEIEDLIEYNSTLKENGKKIAKLRKEVSKLKNTNSELKENNKLELDENNIKILELE